MCIETSDRNPGVVSVSASYQYDGEGSLNITRFVESNLKIYGPLPEGDFITNKREAGLWTQQGAVIAWGADYVIPMHHRMGTRSTANMDAVKAGSAESGNENTVSRNNWFWGNNGGLPFNAFWGINAGILIGAADPYHIRCMEMPTRGSAIRGQHDTAYQWVGYPGKTLQSGVETEIGTTIIGVFDSDNYTASNTHKL